MAKISLNKNTLNKQKQLLKSYQRYLPALMLKQQQLMMEKKRAQQAVSDSALAIEKRFLFIKQQLPMLGSRDINLSSLVKVTAVKLDWEHISGVSLPVVADIHLTKTKYGFLSRPHWVDNVAEELALLSRLKIEHKVNLERLSLLENAGKLATQRVNLFSKILMPEAKNNIHKIKVFLSDSDAASVVRSKITKKKRGINEWPSHKY